MVQRKKMISKEFTQKYKDFWTYYEIKKLIKIYDSTKIFILPSYTEGFPRLYWSLYSDLNLL